jgi:hypothetical protein
MAFDGDNFLPEYSDALDHTDFKYKLQYKYSDALLVSTNPDPYLNLYTCKNPDPTDDKMYC